MPVCAKIFFSWVRNDLSIAKTYISPGNLQGAVVFVTLAAGVSLVSILQEDNWASVYFG